MFSLLSAKDREKLQRMSDSAKQVTAGKHESPTPKMEIDPPPESSTKSVSDSEYRSVPGLVFDLAMKLLISLSRY